MKKKEIEKQLLQIEGRRRGRTFTTFYRQVTEVVVKPKDMYGLTAKQFYGMKSEELEKHIFEHLKKRYKGPNKIMVMDKYFVYPEEAMAAEAFNVVFSRDFDRKIIEGRV
jgi:hypothetical protein